MLSFLEKYQKEIVPILQSEFGLVSLMSVPRVIKVVINQGIARVAKDEETLKTLSQDLAQIAGQKPSIKKARKSIAGFKLVKGEAIGLTVTLRKRRMEDFLTKLFNIVLPRVRDFRGLSPSGFDGHGNYTLGIEEQTVFPEVEFGKTEKVKGLEITIVTNAQTDQKAKRLLELMGMPFKQVQSSK